MKKKVLKMEKFRPLIILPLLPAICLFSNQLSADSIKEKIKETVDDVSEFAKKEIEKLGDDLASIQNYLENYAWKGMIQDHATVGGGTLSYLRLNGHDRVAVVKGGEKIHGVVECSVDPKDTFTLNIYRVVIGLKGEGPQTTIAKNGGAFAGDSVETFTLVAPMKSGFYQIRFRTTDNILESKALESWWDEKGNEPDATTTIGIIYVKS